MSSPTEYLEIIHNNPFAFSKVFYIFFSELEPIENNVLLSYLLLPLVLYPASRKFLVNKKASSKLINLKKKDPYTGAPSKILGITDRIVYYKKISNITVQYLIDLKVFNMNSNSISISKEFIKEDVMKKDILKATSNLAQLIKNYNVVLIYRSLGIKKL